jgi:hypothetical protein
VVSILLAPHQCPVYLPFVSTRAKGHAHLILLNVNIQIMPDEECRLRALKILKLSSLRFRIACNVTHRQGCSIQRSAVYDRWSVEAPLMRLIRETTEKKRYRNIQMYPTGRVHLCGLATLTIQRVSKLIFPKYDPNEIAQFRTQLFHTDRPRDHMKLGKP